MADQARVYSAKALNDCRAALQEFTAVARAALSSVDSDIHRVTHWLKIDRPAYWKHEIRKRDDAVTACRLEIQRKKLIAAPEPASVVFEERQLRKAIARVDSGRQRLAAVHRWSTTWERESGNQKSACRRLNDALAAEIPRAIADLERIINALEGYVALKGPRPEADVPPADNPSADNPPADGDPFLSAAEPPPPKSPEATH